jgi:DNA-binding transcriptional MerR regulator
MTAPRTYTTAAFAALAGVTTRALHHYDRLGLLKPKRSSAGYRIYSDGDLQTLEEIVALKFIGIPLKAITATRRQSKGRFADVLYIQRRTLEAKRSTLTRAIAAIGAAGTVLRSGTAINAELFRQIIEVMHMDTNPEDTMAKYTALLKTKLLHITALSAQERAALQQQFSELIEEVKGSLDEDPAGPKAQHLLERWASLLQALTGTAATKLLEHGSDAVPFRATPELRDELWARRAEWLPPDARTKTEPTNVQEARNQVLERMKATFGDSRVWEFLKRARDSR